MPPHNLAVALGVVGVGVLLAVIGNAEPAAEIDMRNFMAVGAQVAHQFGEQGEGRVERREIGELRADVHVDAGDLQPRQAGGAGVYLARQRQRHAEFVFLLAGGDFGVRFRVDVGVHPQRDFRAPTARRRDGRDGLEFGLGFDVETENPGAQRRLDLSRGLADAGEGDFPGATPAFSARASSPPDTTSMPAPSEASSVSTA